MGITAGIDIDDTVCILSPRIDDEVGRLYSVDVDRSKYFLGERYIDKTTRKPLSVGLVRKIMYNKIDWLRLDPVPGAPKAIARMQSEGVKIVFITHRSEVFTPQAQRTTRRWLDKYFRNYDVVYIRDKMHACKEYNVDYLIDNDHNVLLSENKNHVEPIFFTGIQPTTIKNVGLQKYPSWVSIYSKIMAQ